MNDLLTDMMLTEKEVCEWLSISRYTLYRYRKDGTLRECFQLGRRGTVRYSLKELREKFLIDDPKVWALFRAREKARRDKRKVKSGTSANLQ